MRFFRFVIVCSTLLHISCRPGSIDSLEKGGTAFQEVLDDFVASSTRIHGAMLHVEVPAIGLSWSGASGVDDKQAQTTLHPAQPFRIASVTKTFVAATVLRLVEEGKLALSEPISRYISQTHQDLLKEDRYDLDKITIQHLLSHTSGLFDYALGNENYPNLVAARPQYRWSRTEQLKAAIEYGDPYGMPGETYHYSDTGYILLGEIIESVYDTTMAEAMRVLLNYDELALNETWLESVEAHPEESLPRVHQYFQEYDTYTWDPSMDLYGGGGLVSTTFDLARFFYLLFNDSVFKSPDTDELMLTQTELSARLSDAKSGVVQFEVPEVTDYRLGVDAFKLYGMDVYAHTGFWGVLVAYIPAIDASIAINIPNGYPGDYIAKKSVLIIQDLIQQQEGH